MTVMPDTLAALRVTALQAALLLTWTVYSLFVPAMAARCGIPAGQVVWILVADQIIFVLCDWLAGVYADRVGPVTRRIERTLGAAGLLSAALLAAMPWISSLGRPVAWHAVVAVWAISSSFLRAPAFALLGRLAGKPRGALAGWSLVGLGLAGAAGPLVTRALASVQPEVPLAAAALVLAGATRLAVRADADARPASPSSPAASASAASASPLLPPAALGLAGCILVAAFGMQVHTVLVPGKTLALPAGSAAWWAPLFWAGFAVGLPVGARLSAPRGTQPWASLALACGAAAMLAIPQLGDTSRYALQGVAGAAWAVALGTAVALALDRGGRTGVATPVGLIFSGMAAATVMRLLLVASQLDIGRWLPAIAAASWLACAALLARHPWTRPANRPIGAADA